MADREKLVVPKRAGESLTLREVAAILRPSLDGLSGPVVIHRDLALECEAVLLAAADLLDERRETERRAECVDCGKTVILARPPESKGGE